MALTTEGIHAAADKLQANGITPTQTKVREALGGGSFSTIGEALKTWKQEQQENEQLKRTEMPDNLRDEGVVFIAKLWQEANQIANANLSTEREALTIAQTEIQIEINNVNEAIVALEAEQLETLNLLKLSKNKEQIAISETAASAIKITSLNTFITDLTHKLDIEKERTATAKALSTDANNKLDTIHSELDTISNSLIQSRETIATYKANNQAQSNDIERLQVDAVKHKQTHDVTLSQLTKRTLERDDLTKQLASVSGKLEAVAEQSKQLVAERDSSVGDNKILAATNTKLEAINERLVLDIEKLENEIDSLRAERDSVVTDNEALLNEISKLTDTSK